MITVPISVNQSVCNKVPDDQFVALTKGFRPHSLCVDDLVAHVLDGHAFCPAQLALDDNGDSIRKNSAFIQAQLVFLDIDNSIKNTDKTKRCKTPAEGYISFDRLAQDEWCQKNLFMAYTTPSHTNEWHRFRMVFCLPEIVTNALHYGEIIRAFVDRFDADPACKAIAHVYYGNTNADVRPFGNVLSQEFVVGTLERKAHLNRELKVIEPRVNGNITTDSCREILRSIPAKLDYIDWVKVISGVASHFEPDVAEQLINEWSPGEPGEVSYKIRHKLASVSFGTVVYIARDHGWDDPNGIVKKKRGPKGIPIPDDAVARTKWGLHDVGNGQRLVDDFAGELLYDFVAKRWLVFDGKRFVDDTLSSVTARAVQRLTKIKDEVEGVDDPGIAEAIRKHAKKSLARGSVDNAINLASRGTDLACKSSDFDRDPMLLNLRNCVFNLKTFEMGEHSPQHMMTKLIDIDFDEKAECPKWEAFLTQIFSGDDEMIEFLQRSIGYSLTGLTDEQYFWFCHGGGANGKSVFFNVLQMLFGDYYHKSPVEMLLQSRNGGGEKSSNDIAAIVGKRLLVTDEFPKGRKLDAERVKNITGGDLISARFLFQEFFQFHASCKLWIYGNHYPEQTDRDKGFWRRVFIIPFEVTIPEDEQRPMSLLLEEFKAEASGILRWAIDGYDLYRNAEDRLGIPAKVLKARDELKAATDVLGAFLEETVIDAPMSTLLPSSELYKPYVEWAKTGNEFVYSKKKFAAMLAERGWHVTKNRLNQTCFMGKALNTAVASEGSFFNTSA